MILDTEVCILDTEICNLTENEIDLVTGGMQKEAETQANSANSKFAGLIGNLAAAPAKQ